MGVMCKVGIKDYSVNGECGVIRGHGGKTGEGEKGKEKTEIT
jgi:hypothetical protein